MIAFYGFRARGDPFEIAQVILVCASASTVGTLVPYFVARRWGMPVASRLARFLEVDERRLDEWVVRIRTHGFRDVLIGRLIPGLRVAMSLVAGMAEVPLREFSPGVFIAACIYWTGWVLLGVFVGPAVDVLIEPYIGYVVVAIPIVFAVLFVARMIVVRRRHQR